MCGFPTCLSFPALDWRNIAALSLRFFHSRPDLAIEVLSEGNTPREMARKVREYFDSGCRLVWVIDPRTRTIAVYTSLAKPIVLTEKQTLTGGDVLLGFRLPLRKLFGLLDDLE